jgi:hypothetical protein
VAVFEISPIQMEFFDGRAARSAIPTVGENYAAIVPEQRAYFRHGFLKPPGVERDGSRLASGTIIPSNAHGPKEFIAVPIPRRPPAPFVVALC